METEVINEKPTDMEVALNWAYHIKHPCTVMVDGEEKNIRDFYLRVSKDIILPKLTNPFARRFLQMEINEYNS